MIRDYIDRNSQVSKEHPITIVPHLYHSRRFLYLTWLNYLANQVMNKITDDFDVQGIYIVRIIQSIDYCQCI